MDLGRLWFLWPHALQQLAGERLQQGGFRLDWTPAGDTVTLQGDLYDEVVNAEQEVSLSLERRNDLQDLIYEMMKKYRIAVPSVVPDGDPPNPYGSEI